MKSLTSACVRSTTSKLLSMALTSALTLALILTPLSVAAQTVHSVMLTFTASVDAAANPTLTYNMYRLNGSCPAVAPTSISGSGFTRLNATAITTTTFKDVGVAPGTYCYFASAFLNSTESVPSNDASGIVQPAAPTSLGISVVARNYMFEVKVPS
jgi:hypothetical protein